VKLVEANHQFLLYCDDGPFHVFPRRHVVAAGKDLDVADTAELDPPQGIVDAHRLDGVAEEVDADHPFLLVGGKDLDDVAADAEGPSVEIDVVPLVLDVDEPVQEVVAGDVHPLFEVDLQVGIALAGADAVDAGDAGDDDDVAPFQERARGRVAHLVDLVVDGGILFDVGVRGGDVGLGLVVVVITDEILHGVVGEEGPEFVVELGGQRLVVGDDEGGALHALDDIGHGEGLPRTGDPQEDLVRRTILIPLHEALNRPGLIPPGYKIGDDFEVGHWFIVTQLRVFHILF